MWFMTPEMLTREKQNTMLLFKIILLVLLMYEVHGQSFDVGSRMQPFQEQPEEQPIPQLNGCETAITDNERRREVRNIEPTQICEGSTFCEDDPEYPEHIVNEAIRMNPSLLNYATVDAISDIAPRVDILDEEALCVSTERIVYPKSAQSISGTWMFVVNQPNYSQGVLIETCMEDGGKCKLVDGFAQGYVTECKQKYIYRRLTAITLDGSLSPHYFRFPASCCCHVRFVGDM